MKQQVWLVAMALGSISCALAQQGAAVQFSGSGFLTVAAGKILGGTPDNPNVNPSYLGYKGPHYISDWAQGGVYEGSGLQLNPETKLGLQGVATFTPSLSATLQVVTRGARDYRTNLEWLYGSYKVTDSTTLQIGRKRLPIFSYSESQDVGFAYTWARLPPETYGWQVVNYSGANLMHQDQIGNWSYTANIFAGAETNKDTGYQKMYNGKNTKTNVRWTNILGGDLTLSKDWFETRLGYFQNDFENGVTGTGGYGPKSRQKIKTLGFAIDYDNWIVRNEYYFGDLTAVEERDYAQHYALGYRIGKFTPMFTYGDYYTRYIVGGPLNNYSRDDEERHDVRTLTLRYDLGTSSDIKIQFDDYRDRSGAKFKAKGSVVTGNARLLTISYDMVF